jgi:excinuclease ABC subunit A
MLNRLGLSYLALSRSGDSLSGGESQRLRLAAQLGSNLSGVCYILDEPTIGLHARDCRALLDALNTLRGRGNTILVVEHDEQTIREADTIVEIGPGAGKNGGRIVFAGSPSRALSGDGSAALKKVLSGAAGKIATRQRAAGAVDWLEIEKASANNLKAIDVALPLGTLICVTGVSGSGKSSLLKETVFRGIEARLQNRRPPGNCVRMNGWRRLARVLEVDHSPIGRTPRSIPASYIGILGTIRRLFAGTAEARARGYGAQRFSFNLAGGRCESCKGQGRPRVRMNFLPDAYVTCDVCGGRRFKEETLEVRYKQKNIHQVLQMTFDEALVFFEALPVLKKPISFACSIGLGYLQLGQPSPTLSGGESQRMKLARQLARPGRGHAFYILDEPTTGLHVDDVDKLMAVLQSLVDAGNTVAVIEHNLEVIRAADYIVDLGPGGGEEGGEIVAQGSPREILEAENVSHTARFLKKYIGPR